MDPLSRQKPGQCAPRSASSGPTIQPALEQVDRLAQGLTQSLLSGSINPIGWSAGHEEAAIETVTASLGSLSSQLAAHQYNLSAVAAEISDEYGGSNSTFYQQLNNSEKTGQFTSTASSPFGGADIQYKLEALNERWQLFLSVLYSLTAITSFILNIITIIVLARYGRSELRKYLINLSMSDLLMSLFSIPFTYTEYMLGRWIFSAFLCPVVRFVVTLSVFVSAATMTVIGMNRHLAIIYPCSRLRRGWTRVRKTHVIVAIWLVGIVISSPEYLMFSVEPFCYEGQYYGDCRQLWPESISHSYTIFIYLCTFAIPFALLSYLYARMGLKLWRSQMPGNMDLNRDLTVQTVRLKAIKMLFVVVIVFAVSWLPLQTYSMVLFLYPEVRENIEYQSVKYNIVVCAYFVCHWLSMAHSCLNPLIYCFMNDKFRSDLQALICKRDRHFLSSQRSLPARKSCSQAHLFAQLAAGSGDGGRSSSSSQWPQTGGMGAISLRKSSSILRAQLRPAHPGGANVRTNRHQAAVAASASAKAASAAGGAQDAASGSDGNGAPANQWATSGPPTSQVGTKSSETLERRIVDLAERQVGETLFVKVLRQPSGGQQLFVCESSLERAGRIEEQKKPKEAGHNEENEEKDPEEEEDEEELKKAGSQGTRGGVAISDQAAAI